MSGLGDLVGKARNLAEQHKDQVDQAIDKAGNLVDQKTGGKYSGQIDKAQDAAKRAVDRPAAPAESAAPAEPAGSAESAAKSEPAASAEPAPPAS
ncbi:antitoxin [Skermania piniformis]|uniref:Antitoxin n=1 Tax=Skermania pinensis TaxID=39122 RepID=A0ABX8S7F7_9ACTN|nr:antitoxin [Skermania piniformis]QXQ13122.1 antitoxin [Skermania piniformis]